MFNEMQGDLLKGKLALVEKTTALGGTKYSGNDGHLNTLGLSFSSCSRSMILTYY